MPRNREPKLDHCKIRIYRHYSFLEMGVFMLLALWTECFYVFMTPLSLPVQEACATVVLQEQLTRAPFHELSFEEANVDFVLLFISTVVVAASVEGSSVEEETLERINIQKNEMEATKRTR